jgi:hypothetical protein
MAWIKNSRGVDVYHDSSWDDLADQIKAQAAKMKEYQETLERNRDKLTKKELEEAVKQAEVMHREYDKILEAQERIHQATEKQEKNRDNVRAQFEEYERDCGPSDFTNDPLIRAFLHLPERKLPQKMAGFPDIKNFKK